MHNSYKMIGDENYDVSLDEKDGFHNATCYLPDYTGENINGYTKKEMDFFKELVRNNAHVILEFAQEGDYKNASDNEWK